MNLDLSKVCDLEFDGISFSDYPDFCNAYISNAVYPKVENPRFGFPEDWRDLTEEELYWLQDNNGEWFYERLLNYIY